MLYTARLTTKRNCVINLFSSSDIRRADFQRARKISTRLHFSSKLENKSVAKIRSFVSGAEEQIVFNLPIKWRHYFCGGSNKYILINTSRFSGNFIVPRELHFFCMYWFTSKVTIKYKTVTEFAFKKWLRNKI